MGYGKRIRQLREAAGIAQGALSQRAGFPRQKDLCLRETGAQTMTEAEYLRAKASLLELVAERDAAFAEARKQESAV